MHDSNQLRESQLKLIQFVLLFFVLTGPCISIIHYLDAGLSTPFIVQTIASFIAFIIFLDFNRHQKVERGANFMCLFGMLYLSYRYYSYGEYMSPTVVWMMVISPSMAWLGKPTYALTTLFLTFIVFIINFFLIFSKTGVMPEGRESVFIFSAFTISGYLTYLIMETKLLSDRVTSSILKVEREKMYNHQLYILGEFAGNIAHEINNPLQVIKGNASRLRRKTSKPGEISLEKISHYAATIDRTVDRTKGLINSLIKLSKNPEEDNELNTYPFYDIWRDIKPLLEEKITSLGIGISISNEKEFIYCNKDLLGQVLLNLINNSIYEIKYLENPWIRLHITSQYIEYTDSAHALSEDLKKRILSPLFTFKESRGYGLGLNLAYNLMQHMDGELMIVSDSDHTTFQLVLPQDPL